MPKRSENAKAVAKDVIKALIKGEKVVIGPLMEKHGYTKATAKNPKNVTDSIAYKEEVRPFVDQLIEQRQRMIDAIAVKDLKGEPFSHLSSSIDTFTKNIQLLSGQETERQGVTINIVSYKDDDNHSS